MVEAPPPASTRTSAPAPRHTAFGPAHARPEPVCALWRIAISRMSDELPRHLRRPDQSYRDLVREAVKLDGDALDAALNGHGDPLVNAQAAVNRREKSAWMRDTGARAIERGWNDDPHELIELLSRSDLPGLRLPD